MRTTEQIKKQMTDAVLANPTLRDTFGLTQGQEWDTQVSSVSILNLIIYIVAMAIRTLEWLHDQFKQEVEERIAAAFPGTISWYWNKAMQFRSGYELDENATYSDDEALADDEALIIKHCAIIEADNGIIVKVNKADYERLDANERDAFTAYMNAIKFAGTTVRVYSDHPDQVSLKLYIWRDPMVLGEDLNTLNGDNVIQAAIVAFLDGIAYGGVLNKTRLIDAVQAVPGVRDVTLRSTSSIYCPADGITHHFSDFDQNFTSRGGHFQLTQLNLVERT